MQLNPFPIQAQILKQIIVQVGIVDSKKQKQLKQQLDKKYSKHINLINYHQLRQNRFLKAQQKVLEKQYRSIEKTKEFIELKQNKAYSLKNDSIVHKNKSVQNSLSRWQKIVEKNKEQHQKKINQSRYLIKEWNQKLSESASRKSIRLNNISRTLQEKSGEKISKILIHRHTEQEQQQLKIKNSQEQQIRQSESRYSSIVSGRRNSRISTQYADKRVKKSQQDLLQKSLLKNCQKNQRINEARSMKLFMFQKKNKIYHQKEENLRRLRQYHLSQIKHEVDKRNQKLDQKFKNGREKTKKNTILPSVGDNRTVNIVYFNGQPQYYKKKIHSLPHQISPSAKALTSHQMISERNKNWSPTYDRLIIQKLRNVAILVRRGKKI